VVVRGVVAGLDAAWFFPTQGLCGETVSLESQPAFFRPVQH